MARKKRGGGGLVAAMIGDGTLGQGLLYESMNLASIWELPVLFVVENNQIAQTTPTSQTIGGGDIPMRGAAFGLDTWRLSDDHTRRKRRAGTPASSRPLVVFSKRRWGNSNSSRPPGPRKGTISPRRA